jgi:hypothetical protein
LTEKSNDWPAAAVAITILILAGAVTISAINTFRNPADALQIWEPMSALLALFTGAFITYFFSRGAVQSALLQARNAMLMATQQEQRADATQQALTKAVAMLSPEDGMKVIEDPAFRLATSLVGAVPSGDRGAQR